MHYTTRTPNVEIYSRVAERIWEVLHPAGDRYEEEVRWFGRMVRTKEVLANTIVQSKVEGKNTGEGQ